MNATPLPLDASVATAERRARHHWFEDGLAEIAAGLLFAAIGALFFLEAVAPAGSARAGLSALGLPVLVICGVVIARFAVARLKERITYPRTGYVTYPEQKRPRRRWPAAAAAGAMGALVAALFVNAPDSVALLPALDGLVVGVFLLFVGVRHAVGRYNGYAVASAVVGTIATRVGLGEPLGSGMYFAGFGVVLAVVGAVALAAYLRRAGPPSVEA